MYSTRQNNFSFFVIHVGDAEVLKLSNVPPRIAHGHTYINFQVEKRERRSLHNISYINTYPRDAFNIIVYSANIIWNFQVQTRVIFKSNALAYYYEGFFIVS